MKNRLLGLAAIAVAISMTMPAATAGASPGQRWAVCGVWRQIPVPNPTEIGSIHDIAVVSPREAWAVGALGAEETTRALVLHWTGMRWERVAFPKVAFLSAVAVVSPNEVWTVGWRGAGLGAPSHPFTARWDGHVWRSVPIDVGFEGGLHDLAVVPGTHELWAVGSGRVHAIALRWTGRSWVHVRTDLGRSTTFNAVVAFPHVVWAVGTAWSESGRPRMLAARWDGERWHRVPAPFVEASAVDGVSPDTLWAAGSTGGDAFHPVLVHWNGDRWLRVWTGTRRGDLRDVVVPARGVIWAVGSRGLKPPHQPFIVHRATDGWRVGVVTKAQGWFDAIDGTPHNLWIGHSYMVDPEGSEPTYFDTYHRC
jgi:hypothetical protein